MLATLLDPQFQHKGAIGPHEPVLGVQVCVGLQCRHLLPCLLLLFMQASKGRVDKGHYVFLLLCLVGAAMCHPWKAALLWATYVSDPALRPHLSPENLTEELVPKTWLVWLKGVSPLILSSCCSLPYPKSDFFQLPVLPPPALPSLSNFLYRIITSHSSPQVKLPFFLLADGL